ncbi:N-acetylserotonin O-methyltransferase [Hibiscus trionum]|uniref:N-acetylserotonin O-methyltransferase n=1 Tax=Hibiscus trionum TaxID=183268 RepID=A0A9W7JHU4_HIBTR|nr:N-acetylserotonin O-methyltransferase [Hibiscus trionum]GMJ13049.1 N-acetylserotonin O-methyltransferase [Hibiscus trionum]
MATIELDEATLQGQAEIWRFMLSFADSMALKSAVELRIADIIHSQGGAITLSKIASCINGGSGTSSPDITTLARIMRLLVRRKIFTVHHPSDGGDPVYHLTHSSRWLLHDSEQTLAPMILMENHPLLMAPWHCFSQCVKEGGIAFKKAHGREIWDLASENPEFNRLFNDGMACTAKVVTRAILSTGYKEGLSSIGSLVDVGGGTGSLISEIVKAYPHIKGVNFDLQHVVSAAPPYDGVCHVGGDMFQAIPNADAVIMKWILHDWGDEDCIKILRNCRNAIPRGKGKVIIVDIVVKPDGNGPFDDTRFIFDLVMVAHSSGGKERTEVEWKRILEQGGFRRYKIINIPALTSIIEAYPDD